jgi:hypothetical protein
LQRFSGLLCKGAIEIYNRRNTKRNTQQEIYNRKYTIGDTQQEIHNRRYKKVY